MYGENPAEFKDISLWFLYIVTTIVLNVMTLNLLISIIGNTYDRLQSIQVPTDLKQRANLLEQLETILICFRKKGKPTYLHVLKYADGTQFGEEDELVSSSKGDRWEGKIVSVVKKMDKISDIIIN